MNLNSTALRGKLLASVGPSALRCAAVMGASLAGLLALPGPAHAINLYDGSQVGNQVEINLNTTISYTGFYRVNDPSAVLAGPTNANGNDGDSNLRHGIVGNQFEALPVFDVRDGDFGMHVSGEFYLNTTYLGTNQNNQPATVNPYTIAKTTDYTSATRNINGENARLLDAFAFAKHTFADDQSISLKVGRQTLLWGQSLFFASNGISAGQAPLDIIKAESLPNAQAQQVFLPVGQAVITYQPNDVLTFQGYYQFEWEHDTFQGVGAYFSSADLLDKGGQRILIRQEFGLPPTALGLYRLKDLSPPIENGQFGGSVQATVGLYDFGLFGLRYDSKAPEIYAGAAAPGGGPGNVGSYWLVYPRDIQIYGASVSTNLAGANVAGEISGRRNMNLVAAGFGNSAYPGSANAGAQYPIGSTLAAQASVIYVSSAVPFVPGGISVAGEVAMNHVISVDHNKDLLAAGRQATAAATEFTLTPNYYSVLPKLDISFPIGISYDFLGRSEIDGTMNHGTGSFSLGVTATYRTTWIAALTYKDFLGKADTTLNPLADRGYLNLNIQHTF